MDILFLISVIVCLLPLGSAQTPVLEQRDDPIKLTIEYTGATLPDINFKCSYYIPDAVQAYVGGDFSFQWKKEQDIGDAETIIILNHGNTKAPDLDSALSDRIAYAQNIIANNNTAWTQITIKAPRPEDFGVYTCKLVWKDGSTPTLLPHTLNVLDLKNFRVFLHASDNPMMIDRYPNTTEWTPHTDIILREKMESTSGPQQYSYLACVAEGTGTSAIITMSIENPDNPSRNRELHSRMQSVEVEDAIGDVVGAQRKNVVHILEDREFRVNGLDDGSTLICVGKIEDAQNNVIKELPASAKFSLLSKPQFVNCTETVHAPVGATNYMITARIKSKPQPTEGGIIWKVGTYEIPKVNSYGYTTDVEGEGKDMYLAKLTIAEVSQTEHIQSVFTVIARNEIGSNECRIQLLEGKDGQTGNTIGSSVCVTSTLLLLLVSALAAFFVQ